MPATFFNIGVNQAARPTLVESEAVLGMVLGNHTWDHPQMQTLSASAQASEMDSTANEQAALVGRAPCFFRPPYGSYNSTTLALAQQRRMQVWNWNVDTLDWQATSTVNSVVSLAESEGGVLQHPVILMHNPPGGTNGTVGALPTIISYFASRGYRFVTLAGTPGLGFPGPAGAATTGGLHVFARAASGALTERTQSSGSWTGAAALGGVQVGSPAATAVDATTSAAFVIGTDNSVWERTTTDTGGGGWTRLGGIATSRPGAAAGANGVVTVVVRGIDQTAWMRQQTAGIWGAWQSLGGFFNFGFAVGATPSGGLVVAGVGLNNALYVRVETGTRWSAWQQVPAGIVNDDPALAVTPSGRLLAVVRGLDNTCWVAVGDPTGTSWSWQHIGGILASAPTVTVVGSTAAVFVVGLNGQTYENIASDASTGTGWGGWHVLP